MNELTILHCNACMAGGGIPLDHPSHSCTEPAAVLFEKYFHQALHFQLTLVRNNMFIKRLCEESEIISYVNLLQSDLNEIKNKSNLYNIILDYVRNYNDLKTLPDAVDKCTEIN